mgnify:CR=1 FL=1
MNNENWKTVRLGDIFDLQMGKTPDRKRLDYFKGSYKWISIADISKAEKYISETKECLSDEAIESSGIKIIQKNTVIMSFKLSLGKTAITTKPMYSNEAIMSFLPNGKYEVNNDFLYHLFSNKDWSEGCNKAVKGVTLNKASLSEAKIPLPPLATQKHIAAVLDKCTEVIAKHKQMLEKYDTLVKSQFVEMFESQEFPKETIDLLCSNIVDCPHTTPKYEGELKNPAIRTSEIKKGFIKWDTMRYVSDMEYEERISRLKPESGDIVYGREGSFGNAAILPTGYKFCLGQRVMLLRPNYSICNSEYMLYALISDTVFHQALMLNNTSTVAHINVADVKKFKIPVPPLALQEKFAAFVQAVDAQKAKAQKSLDKAETLYKALMQAYFGA